jgi:hypothetical protein
MIVGMKGVGVVCRQVCEIELYDDFVSESPTFSHLFSESALSEPKIVLF